MSNQISLKDFEKIYNLTYNQTLKYIICKCSNIDDVNDIIQDTYVELYNILKRKGTIMLDNTTSYIIGIAKKKLLKHYGILYKLKKFSLWNDEDTYLDIPSEFDLEDEILTRLNAKKVLEYIRKKDIMVIKVFYLYYYLDLKISQIATALALSESNVKNILYRTIKDIKKNVKIEGDIDV